MLRLELTNISKTYPAVKANDRVNLRVKPGEIHAVLGENGAGKSTLMKMIYGAVRPDEGEIRWNGEPVQVRNPQEARALGISMVFQHFSLFDTLTAAENVWLGLDKTLNLAEIAQRITTVSRDYGLDVDPLRPVHTLSVGERQRVEIVRALMTGPKLLILDEPTSVLTPQAVQTLFLTLRKLAEEGCSILYISHKLDEIRELCHQCTVLRGGKVTGECDPRTQDNASLSRLMIGSEPPPLQHKEAKAGAIVFAVRDLSLPKQDHFGIEPVAHRLRRARRRGGRRRRGVGQRPAGTDGRAVGRGLPRRRRRRSACSAQPIGHQPPRKRREAGLHFVPEERLGRGAVPTLSLAANTMLTRTEAIGGSGWIATAPGRRAGRHLIDRFKVKAGGPGAAAKSLSGGNLQKFLVGREIDANPKLLIVSQPTWGVDVGAAALIRGELLKLRDAGCALLVVSEELDELFEICDRLIVIAQGKVSPSIATAEATVEQIGIWMSGLWDGAGTASASGASTTTEAQPCSSSKCAPSHRR